MTKIAVQLIVSILTNAARIEHDDVGVVFVACLLVAVCGKKPSNALRVMLIHLTPIGANDVTARHIAQASGGGDESEPAHGRCADPTGQVVD